jgi:predicted DNA-binding ribbon-helix-helix protein
MSRTKTIENGVKASFFLSEAMMTEMKAMAARKDIPVSALLRQSWDIAKVEFEKTL